MGALRFEIVGSPSTSRGFPLFTCCIYRLIRSFQHSPNVLELPFLHFRQTRTRHLELRLSHKNQAWSNTSRGIAALSQAGTIFVTTHDSIAVGAILVRRSRSRSQTSQYSWTPTSNMLRNMGEISYRMCRFQAPAECAAGFAVQTYYRAGQLMQVMSTEYPG